MKSYLIIAVVLLAIFSFTGISFACGGTCGGSTCESVQSCFNIGGTNFYYCGYDSSCTSSTTTTSTTTTSTTTSTCATGNYCDGSIVKYRYSDCSWSTEQSCTYGCANDNCNSAPAPSCTTETYCDGSTLKRKSSSCTISTIENCEYGCTNGQCNSAPLPVCGNGVVESGETCDKSPAQSQSCGSGVCAGTQTKSCIPAGSPGQCTWSGWSDCSTKGTTCSTGTCTLSSGACGSGTQSTTKCSASGYCTDSSSTSCPVGCSPGQICSGGGCIASCPTTDISGLSCPSTVNTGQSFTISYNYKDAGPTYKYDYRTVWQGSTRLNPCRYGEGSNTCTNVDDSFEVTAPSTAGTYTYYIKGFAASTEDFSNCDRASWDNIQSCTVTVVKPDSSPTGSASIDKNFAKLNEEFVVTVTGNDDKQVNWLRVIKSYDTDNWFDCRVPSRTTCTNGFKLSRSAEGKVTYYAQVYDSLWKYGDAGNLSITIDGTKPTSSITKPLSGKFSADFTVTASSSDQTSGGVSSGLKDCYYHVFDKGLNKYTKSWGSRPCTGDFTVTVGTGKDCETIGTDTCEVRVFAEDNAGNIEATDVKTYSISEPCSGKLQLTIDPDSVVKSTSQANSYVRFIASAPSGCSGSKVEFRGYDGTPSAYCQPPGCQSSTTNTYLVASCESWIGASCEKRVTAPSKSGLYYYYATIDNKLTSPIVTLQVNENNCNAKAPSKTFTLNGCSVKIEAYAFDSSGQGTYKGGSVGDTSISTSYDDSGSSDCDGEAAISVSWSILGSNIDVKGSAYRISKGSYGISYGHKISTSTNNCKLLNIGSTSKTYYTSGPPGSSDPITFDTRYSYGPISYTVGECSSNSDCKSIYGDTKPVCNSANMCESIKAPSAPILNSPSDGETVNTLKPGLDWTDVTGAVSYNVYVRAYSDSSLVYSGCLIPSETTATGLQAETTYIWSANACAGNLCTNCGAYAAQRSFTTQKNACITDLDCDFTNNIRRECKLNDATSLKQCDVRTSCSNPANDNSLCYTNYCCNAVIGKGTDCVQSGTISNPYLCTSK